LLRLLQREVLGLKKSLLLALLGCVALMSNLQFEQRMCAQTLAMPGAGRGRANLHSLHLQGSVREVLQEALAIYGVEVVLVSDEGFASRQLRVDADGATLESAGEILRALTRCSLVPVDRHLILAMPQKMGAEWKKDHPMTETISTSNLMTSPQQTKAASELLSNVFGVVKTSIHGNEIVMQASPEVASQARGVLAALDRPRPQIMLNVRAYAISRTHNRNLGVEPPQSVAVFNVYSAAESLISSNSSIVEALIEEGLVSAGDTLGIAELLIAGGYASSSVLGSSSLYFGGGETTMGVQFNSAQANATLSESTVRELQAAQLQLKDGETGKFRVGEHYPVLASTSSVLGSTSSNSVTPSIEYEDLGLTLEASAHLEADDEVLVHLHETIRSLAGSSLNEIPILDNQEVATDLSVAAGVTTVLVSNLSKSEALATQGLMGLIPTDASKETTDSQLLITITPVVTRGIATGRDSR
jgi:type II secretory pathway component GspD/PulD (secretin)